MRKVFTAFLLTLCVLIFSGCSKDKSNTDFGYRPEGAKVTLVPGEKFNADEDGLSATIDYFEGASCYYDGLDKQFKYEGYEVTTYPGDNGDIIQDISISAENVKTSKGVGVGSALSDVEKAYGKDYKVSGKMYQFYQDDTRYIYFFILNDVVKYYGYAIDVR